MVVFEHMVPSSKDVTIDGMKSEDGINRWEKLKEKDKLGLTEKDSFVVFVTSKEFSRDSVDMFRERMQSLKEMGGAALESYIAQQLNSGKTIGEIKRDVHPFIQTEVQITAMIAKAGLRERTEDDM